MIASSKKEASEMVQLYLDQGNTNIDLGVMQVNLRWHGKYFKNIEEMLTPEYNIKYAAKLLTSLYQQHGTWQKAVRYYHSAKPEYHRKYSKKIILTWLSN